MFPRPLVALASELPFYLQEWRGSAAAEAGYPPPVYQGQNETGKLGKFSELLPEFDSAILHLREGKMYYTHPDEVNTVCFHS